MQGVHHSIGNSFIGTYFEEAIQLYGFGHVFQGKNFWDKFLAMRYFFLARSCECDAVKYFIEAIK
jgi:hypothetical protein